MSVREARKEKESHVLIEGGLKRKNSQDIRKGGQKIKKGKILRED